MFDLWVEAFRTTFWWGGERFAAVLLMILLFGAAGCAPATSDPFLPPEAPVPRETGALGRAAEPVQAKDVPRWGRDVTKPAGIGDQSDEIDQVFEEIRKRNCAVEELQDRVDRRFGEGGRSRESGTGATASILQQHQNSLDEIFPSHGGCERAAALIAKLKDEPAVSGTVVGVRRICGEEAIKVSGRECELTVTGQVELDRGHILTANLDNKGRIHGIGVIHGNVLNEGTLSPGLPIGTLVVGGDYAQRRDGMVSLEIAGRGDRDAADKLLITGARSLGGTLDVTLTGGAAVEAGDTIEVVSFQSRTGEFATVNLPELPDDLGWKVIYTDRAVVLKVVPSKGE